MKRVVGGHRVIGELDRRAHFRPRQGDRRERGRRRGVRLDLDALGLDGASIDLEGHVKTVERF
jgi:hypothetical protein